MKINAHHEMASEGEEFCPLNSSMLLLPELVGFTAESGVQPGFSCVPGHILSNIRAPK